MSDEGQLSPRDRSDSGEELKLSKEEAQNVVADYREIQKKLDLEEEQEILEAAYHDMKDEEEKVPLEVLQKKPEEITQMLEEQFIKEIEQASAKDAAKSGKEEDSKKEDGSKGASWRWPWGRLPEKAVLPSQEKIEPISESKIASLPTSHA